MVAITRSQEIAANAARLAGKAYLVIVGFKTGKRRVRIDPEHARLSTENVNILRSKGAKVSTSLDPYPAVGIAASYLNAKKRDLIARVGGVQACDGGFLMPSANIEEWDAGWQEIESAFLEKSEELKAGWADAYDFYRSQIMAILVEVGNDLATAQDLWQQFYEGRFYTLSELEPPHFACFQFVRKELEFGSKEDQNSVKAATASLSAQLESLAEDIRKMQALDPTDGRVKPQARLEALDEIESQMRWLGGLFEGKLNSYFDKIFELREEVISFQRSGESL